MLTEKIMHEVIKRLLLGYPPDENYNPSEEEIEVLCKLWTTVGQVLDRAQAATYINHYFQKMRQLEERQSLPRIKFLLQNVIDLRENNWVARREEEKAQTLKELQSSIQQKEAAKIDDINRRAATQRQQQHALAPNRNTARAAAAPAAAADQGAAAAGRGAKTKGDEWSTVGARRPTGSSKVAQIVSPSAMTFGPQTGRGGGMGGGAGGWGRGGGDAGKGGQEDRRGNAFEALSGGGKGAGRNKKGRDNKGSSPVPDGVKGDSGPPSPIEEVDWDQVGRETAGMLLEEFANANDEDEVLKGMSGVNPDGHMYVVKQAILNVVARVNFTEKRGHLAGVLRAMLREPAQGTPRVVQAESVHEGFKAYLIEVVDCGLQEDNPRIWESFGDLIYQCLSHNSIFLNFLNDILPDDFLMGDIDQVLYMVAAVYSALQKAPDGTKPCCSGHWDILQILLSKTKEPDALLKVISKLADKGCIEVDPSMYIFHALRSQLNPDELLGWLQDHIPEDLGDSPRISQKVAAPIILYSALELGLINDTAAGDPKEAFHTIRNHFDTKCKKPILKYTQNKTQDDKMLNELQFVLEAQRYCHFAGFPKGLLCNLFQVLYDLEVVTEETYTYWKELKDPAFDKATALKEVNSFISFLESAAEEDNPDE